MPRKLEFVHRGNSFHAAIHKVDRTKLYGRVDIETLDSEGRSCGLATLASDGRTLIPYGGTAFGYLNTEGEWVNRNELVPVDLDGNELPSVESSFSGPTTLSAKVSVEEFLDHSIRLCYALTSDDFDDAFLKELKEGTIFRIPFSYRGGVEADPAFLLEGKDGTPWLLVGVENQFELIGLEQAGTGVTESEDGEEDSGGDDDFDFDMM